MTSFHNGRPTGLTKTRPAGSIVLGGRVAVAEFTNQHSNTIARYCVPIACDVATRGNLYDLEAAVRQFSVATYLCCITDERGDRCGSEVMTNAPAAVCAFHAAEIGTFWQKQDLIALARERLIREQGATGNAAVDRQRTAELLAQSKNEVVYYLQVGELVKIGFTGDLARRMQEYPPNSRLLTTEPGGRSKEAQRHRQFMEYLQHGTEWFVAGPKLRKHIEALMAKTATPRTARSA